MLTKFSTQILTLTLLTLPSVGASCLKSLDALALPAKFKACEKDADCQIYDDACRSCGPNVAAFNREFIESVRKLDYARRKFSRCMIACEACGTSHLKVRCVEKICQVEPAKPKVD